MKAALTGLSKGKDIIFWVTSKLLGEMTMKIGRNAPCPCGSGKKFKKCCLNKTVTPIETLDYRRLSKSLDHLMPRLIDYGQSVFGEKVVTFAMDEFLG